MWEIKQSAQDNVLNMYIYGEVEGDTYDWQKDEVIRSETSANFFREELAKYPNTTEINIFINSYGGSVFEGTAIYNQLKRHPAKKTVYIDGFACSVASVIAMAGDKVIMPKNAMMMIHNAWLGTVGNAAEIRKTADDLDIINSSSKQAYLQKAGKKITEEHLVAMMNAETWLTAEQCIEYGFADEYAEKDADMSNASKILQNANMSLEQRINIQKSLASQLKQLVDPEEIPKEKISGEEIPKEEIPKEESKKQEEPNNIMKMLGGFFNV